MEKSILVVADYYDSKQNAGGAPVSIQNLLTILNKFGYKTIVITRNKIFNSKNKFVSKKEKINYRENQIIYYIDGFLPIVLFKKFRELSFSMIYLNSFFSTLTIFTFFYFSLFHIRKKIVVSPKGELFYGALHSHNFIIKRIYIAIFNTFFSKNVIFHFSSDEELLIANKFINVNKYHIAIDIYERNEMHTNVTNNKNEFNIIFLSRIDKKKNLLFACNILSKLKLKINFDIYGTIADMQYFNECMNILAENPDFINANYCGVLDKQEVGKTFSKYDLFLFPTKGENFGYVILESLDSGCPIVLSLDNTLWNNLKDKDAGFNISLEDEEDWLIAISKIYNSKMNMDYKYVNGAMQYTKNNKLIKNAALDNLKIFENV